MISDIKQKVEYYMALPYTMTVRFCPDQGGYYIAEYVELRGLSMTGKTPEEAVEELLAEKPEWFELCIRENLEIPLPVEPQKYSGNVTLRMPPTLHESLIRISRLERVSLNQYVVSALAKTVGFREGKQAASKEKVAC